MSSTPTSMMSEVKQCKHCKMPIAIRNPSGFCDHLYYPKNCEVCSGKTPPARWEEWRKWENEEVFIGLRLFYHSEGYEPKNGDKKWVMQQINSLRSQAYDEGRREIEKIANQTILRLQIVAVELARRQKDDEAVKIINDIRGKYEELKDTLKGKEKV